MSRIGNALTTGVAVLGILLFTGVAPAQPLPAPSPAAARPRARPWIVHLNVGVVAAQWVGATGTLPSQTIGLADRQTLVQLLGAGRFVRPDLRVMLSFQVAELVGGAPSSASSLALVGAIPWVAWHPIPPVFLGLGALMTARNYGKDQFDLGVFTCAGVVAPLGVGFSAGAAVQVPVMLYVRPAVAVVPALFLAYRF